VEPASSLSGVHALEGTLSSMRCPTVWRRRSPAAVGFPHRVSLATGVRAALQRHACAGPAAGLLPHSRETARCGKTR